jgi:hypothetical protein
MQYPVRFRATARPTFLRTAVAVAAFGGLLGAAACDSDPVSPGGDVDIESVRLTITPATGAATVYTVTANSANDAPVVLRVGTSTIRAEPLDDRGQVVSEAPEFELRLLDLPNGVTFTRNGTLTATVVTTQAVTATPVRAQMWHRAEEHEDYTAVFRIQVTP